MAGPEQTIINDSYTQWRRIFWLMLTLLCAVSALLVWNAHDRNTNAQALQSGMVQAAVTGAAHEIALHVRALRTAVSLFAEKERQMLQRLAADPNNIEIYEQLLKNIKVYFNDGFAATLADEHGNPVVADFDGFVGQLCQADLRIYSQSEFLVPDVYIHSNSIGYHFDIMVPIDVGARKPHIFFISFYPREIGAILSRYQLAGHQLLLLDREVNGLIEIDVQGARDTMQRDHFISETERAQILFSAPVEGTRWRLVDLSATGAGHALGQAVWRETAVAITALVMLSMYFLYTLRQHMRRINQQNATLRAQAQEIQERSEQVINVLERTTDAYVEFDANWHCTYLNSQAGKLLAQSPERGIGQDIRTAFPELAEAFFEEMQKAQAESAAQVFSGFYPPSRWLEIHVHPMADRTTVIMRDITQERAAWERAKDSETRNRAILDHIADAIITIDRNGIIETFNPTAEQVFQYRAQEAIGKNVKILMPEADSEHHDEYIAQYFAGGAGTWLDKTRELIGRRKDGKLFPVELCVTRVKVHESDIFIAAMRDISVRKEVERRIRELARLPDESPTPVMRVDGAGVISYANRPAEEELLHCWDTTVDGDVPLKIAAMITEALAAGSPMEREIVCADQVFLVMFAPVVDGNYVNLYAEDITERKRAGQELKNHRDHLEELVSERTTALVMAHNDALVASRAKSAFLASMSHELRTPLNAIIGYSEMLEENAIEAGNTELGADLRKITGSGRHLLTLINDILDLSKIEAGKVQFSLEEFRVEDLLQDIETTIRPMVTKNQNRFDMVADGELGTMYSDALRVKQVLLNLLSNACKFTTRGRITLMARREITAAGAGLSFIVNDTGIGMSQEQTMRLFEPFTQADRATAIKYGGTGLGLAISRRLCQLMGGDIRLHSALGVGSSFTVRLPAETVAQIEPPVVALVSS